MPSPTHVKSVISASVTPAPPQGPSIIFGSVAGALDQCNHARPLTAAGISQPAMESDGWRNWDSDATGGQVPLDQRALCWPAVRPDSQSHLAAPANWHRAWAD